MTNYEKIKNMSAREMAEKLGANDIVMDKICKEINKPGDCDIDGKECLGCVMQWLNKEVSEED